MEEAIKDKDGPKLIEDWARDGLNVMAAEYFDHGQAHLWPMPPEESPEYPPKAGNG
jgi:hypothetical protein